MWSKIDALRVTNVSIVAIYIVVHLFAPSRPSPIQGLHTISRHYASTTSRTSRIIQNIIINLIRQFPYTINRPDSFVHSVAFRFRFRLYLSLSLSFCLSRLVFHHFTYKVSRTHAIHCCLDELLRHNTPYGRCVIQ